MKISLSAGIALAALTGAAAMSAPAFSADLGGGSMKDGGYMAPMPEMVRSASGNCYFRADVGYTASSDATINWAQTDPVTLNYLTSDVSTLNFDNGAFGEAGVGCGSGSRGLRGEIVFGYRGSRKIDGEPATFWYDPAGPGAPEQDPMHTDLTSYTLMLNAYKDLGNYGGFTPYVGAGVGMAYNKLSDVSFTGNPALVNAIHGDSELALAWSLMAGIGYQISDRAIIDVGYRYMDLGSAQSDRVDTANFVNPRVEVDDITGHEFKIGLRYHFGEADCCAAYAPMK